jgi:hypothetical protein
VGVGIQPFWEEEQVYVGEVQVAASLRDFVRKEGRKLNWKQENIIEVIVVLLLLLLVCSKVSCAIFAQSLILGKFPGFVLASVWSCNLGFVVRMGISAEFAKETSAEFVWQTSNEYRHRHLCVCTCTAACTVGRKCGDLL